MAGHKVDLRNSGCLGEEDREVKYEKYSKKG